MKVLELIDVKKDYKLQNKETFTALSEVNVSFEKGELVSIVGESGSGKSTLMNLIGGLDSDFSGTIKVSGRDLKSFKDKDLDDYRKKKIGFVFQSFNLIPHLSVVDNVTIGLTLSNEKESVKEKKAKELLSKLGLSDQLHKKPTQLSGGQKQRVAIARALINDPDIILADEPTGALDSSTTAQILEILKEIADEGKLVIMVTHSEKVAKISSRVVEISDGKIIRDEQNNEYKPKEKVESSQESQVKNETLTDGLAQKKKKEGHLSLWSAIKLSFHNMWAKKTKNILMAFGVSISLISLILMLSFSSGLTGYISDTAQNYTNPTVVSFSKSGKDKYGNKLEDGDSSPMSLLTPKTFTSTEIDDLAIELNQHLEKKGNDFRIITEGEVANLSYGYNIMTMSAGKITYTPENVEGEEPKKPIDANIIYTYTTPPYYTKKNLLTKTGNVPEKNTPQIMLSRAAAKTFGFNDLEDMVNQNVTLDITFGNYKIQKPVIISGIVDVSFFGSMLVMYIDYDYLNTCVKEMQAANGEDMTGISPSLLYIQTDKEETADLINNYAEKYRKDLSGSMEERIAGMFNEMMDTFSIALTVIAGISLAVALIMILVVLYMSVSERTREIGVLKSIGARKKDIKLIFSSESFLVGLLSGITGIILTLIIGGILTLLFNSLLGFAPLKMMWYYFLEALAISIVISVIAGLYPASKAAKLDPVESLRHE